MTPDALQRAAFEEDSGADARPIVQGGALDIENQTGNIHYLVYPGQPEKTVTLLKQGTLDDV